MSQWLKRANKTYNLMVEYTQGLNPITGWYCRSRSGARTLECSLELKYYRNEIENSETKPSKMHIGYVKDAAVDT